ncbi:uncharacterized protein K460DRAFT_348380 [Cucurbitaria berberidis CBS 394.84]|uniref:Zn(2)-C6 fungal-type domain-containing protein n=1 Tax=Cucurbitaria berberidis CBS 394.84 TaxID=1168544 RepID=A0A9P4G6Z7_9PLEO|nr:uncharacterized protein K460DRAFT_348380 [Cucurbitaria berberidis CBS 394.84]KAF1840198.1 hypothetical protein K460DRAFT_348380 [Cucurbitaria berberidis CBS 394.84]
MTGNLFPARLRVSHQEKRRNPSFRRNGKLQACEPCRKGKLRCDHMLPTCGRCARRNKPEQCVYHPAPLTKRTTIPTPQCTSSDQSSPELNSFSTLFHTGSERSSNRTPSDFELDSARRNGVFGSLPALVQSVECNSVSIPRAVLNQYDEFVPRFSRASSLPAQSWSQSQQSTERRPLPDDQIRADALDFDSRSAFINHNAILAENELSIGIQPPSADSTPMSKVSQSHIDSGAAVLTLLKDLPTIQKYIDKWFSFAGGVVVIEPMVKIYTSGLWSTWQKTLESQRPADLRLMSEKIWENTLRPVSPLLHRHTTPREFCANVTGRFLRWEVVGILVTLVSLVAQSLKDGDPVFCSHDEPPVDRAALARRMCNASEMCVNFCDDFGVLNDLYLWLLYENSVAYCSMRTRGSYENARKLSGLATALLCCNLHQEIKVDDHTPFFIAEFRKRLFICAYENDKHFATFAGRPPKLTRHYCRLQIPLDLTDAQTMAEGLDLENAVDGEGWNQRGTVQRCTFARLSATNALITEEILEVSLGYSPRDEIIHRAAEIETKTNKCWEELPDFLRIDIDNPWSMNRSPLELLFLVQIRLGHLDHHFLLQRTLIKKVGSGSANPNITLLSVCSEIFKLVVLMVDNKDHFRDFQVDFVSILATHGIPTAAVLAVELLHQEQNPSSASAIGYPLHRSDTIQSLAVFVSCLGTIRTEANGFHSCDRGRKFLKRILDMILGPGPAASRSSPPNVEGMIDPTLGAPLLQAGSDGDFVRWLESMEWDQDSLVNFN